MKIKIFIFIFFALAVSFLSSYAEDKVKDFYLSNYKTDGAVAWEVKGTDAVIKDPDVKITNMAAKYYAPDDTVTVTSDKAKLNKANMDLVLKKNVKIESEAGAVLTTDKLNWQKNKNLISTNEEVQINKNDMQITAQGMQADTQMKKVDFTKDVSAQLIAPDTKGPITITCDGALEIEYESGQATFHDNVAVKHEQGALYADTATAYFDKAQKTIARIVCEGNVQIVKDDNTTYAQKATYLRTEGKVVLEGRPRLVYHPKKAQESLF